TFKKYLETDPKGDLYIFDNLPEDEPVDILMYNKGEYPFFPKPYAYLNLAVGYAKERDTATVEVVDITFQVHKDKNGNDARFFYDEETDAFVPDAKGDMAIWMIVYHLGEVVELNRKKSS